MVGDREIPNKVVIYSSEELTDKLDIALLRHKPDYTLENVPRKEYILICYRAAIDLCYELAARSAPFSVNSIEGMTVDKTGVVSNWLQLADRYRDMYVTDLNGGLGSEGDILQGDLTRTSLTTGREVPFHRVKPFDPVFLSLVSISGKTVKISWTPLRDSDFFTYTIYRRTGVGEFTLISTVYNLLTTEFEETLAVAGSYQYRVDVSRGLNSQRTLQYPNTLLNNFQTLITPSNVITVEVV